MDGTKIEANANKYTFVWRGSINYHLVGLLDTVYALYTKYNTLLYENGYGSKYALGDAQMFIIEGMEKVRRMNDVNRKRKLTKHKSGIQKLYEELEATFMRMKENHMLNGQLKPAYKVQIAVGNYFIIHGYVSGDRTDYNTLLPVLEKHGKAIDEALEEVTADSGYWSEKISCI